MTDPDATTLRDLLRPHLALAKATGRPAAAVARDAGMMPEALGRLMREGYNGKASGYEAVARALGLRVALVPVGEP